MAGSLHAKVLITKVRLTNSLEQQIVEFCCSLLHCFDFWEKETSSLFPNNLADDALNVSGH